MPSLTAELAFRTGVVRYADLGFVAATNRALDRRQTGNGIVLTWDNGTWGSTEPFSWSPTGSCFATEPSRHFVVVGGDDSFLEVGGGDFLAGTFGEQLGFETGVVRGAQSIEGWAYAVGYGGFVGKRMGHGQWKDAGKGMSAGAQLEAIDGFSQSDLYAVGVDGVIRHFGGKKWAAVPSPTKAILSCVCCAGDGNVYVGGQDGTLLRGRGSSWQAIEPSGTTAHLWDLEWFKGKLYAATSVAVHVLDQRALKPIGMKRKQPGTAYHLSSCEAALWSVGERDVVSFDGKTWKPVSTQV